MFYAQPIVHNLFSFLYTIFFYSHLISIFSVRSYRESTQKKRELNCSAYSWRKSIIYVAIIYKWEVEMGWWFFFCVIVVIIILVVGKQGGCGMNTTEKIIQQPEQKQHQQQQHERKKEVEIK